MGAHAAPPRLLVVEDEREFLEILELWFRSLGYDVCAAPDGFTALQQLHRDHFDVVLTDLKMPGIGGLQLLTVIKELDPTIEVIILTGQGTMEDAIQALREGRAFDFVLKPIKNLRQLHLVVEKALARRESATRASMPAPDHDREQPIRPWPPHIEALSSRESEIMGLLAQGLDNRAIGDQLCLSDKTIKNNLSRIYEKLQVKSRTQAIRFCRDHGLV